MTTRAMPAPRALSLAIAVAVAAGTTPARSTAQTGGGAERADTDWSVVELGRTGDLSIRVRVQRKASIAETEWFVLEFENHGAGPITLHFPRYSAEALRFDPETDQLLLTSSLASGGGFDLFPHCWVGSHITPISIEPGVHRISEHPSLSSAVMLGLAPENGRRIQARMHMTMVVGGSGKFETPAEGVAFGFDWVRPDERGFAAACQQAARLLAQPIWRLHQVSYLQALLAIPEVARGLPVADLLAAIERQEGACNAREVLAQHLDARCPTDAQVLARYRTRLAAADVRVLDELYVTKRIWDDAFVEPLVKMFEADARRTGKVLWILHGHGRPQRDPAIARRLSAALLAVSLLSTREPDQIWCAEARALALTGDQRFRDERIVELRQRLARLGTTGQKR